MIIGPYGEHIVTREELIGLYPNSTITIFFPGQLLFKDIVDHALPGHKVIVEGVPRVYLISQD